MNSQINLDPEKNMDFELLKSHRVYLTQLIESEQISNKKQTNYFIFRNFAIKNPIVDTDSIPGPNL